MSQAHLPSDLFTDAGKFEGTGPDNQPIKHPFQSFSFSPATSGLFGGKTFSMWPTETIEEVLKEKRQVDDESADSRRRADGMMATIDSAVHIKSPEDQDYI